MNQQEVPSRWNRSKRDLGVTLWVAFLAASFGTYVLFGLIDPGDMESAMMERWSVSRELAYSVGFGFLFAVSLLAAALTAFMIRTGPAAGHASGKGGKPPPRIVDPSENNPDLDLDDLK